MSVTAFLDRLSNQPPDADIDWIAIRKEIQDLFDTATTQERVILLGVFTAVMDLVGKNLADDDLERFNKIRKSDYRLMIIKEALIGENISCDLLHEVTSREIAAGRMSEDDPLRDLALKGVNAPHLSPSELRMLVESPADGGLLSRFRLFRR